MERKLKFVLAALLFVCLLDMPYGYYQLVRTIALFAFAFLGFRQLSDGNHGTAYLYFGLAFLFQPIFKIALGREIWNVVDLVVGIGLLVSAFKSAPKSPDSPN